MQKEEWRDIPETYGLYQVSNLGRVKSLHHFHGFFEKIMRFDETDGGYYQVTLSVFGKKARYKVHRLVAMLFIPNPLNLPQINHKNENKKDNRAENLEWCDAKYNVNYGTSLARRIETIGKKVLCHETGKRFPSCAETGRQMGIDYSHIAKCCRGILKHYKGYHFSYIEYE